MIRKSVLFLSLSLSTLPAMAQPQARIQLANNCAEVAMNAIDVYMDGVLVLDNLMYRTATPFLDVPATVPFTVSIAPESSLSVADAFYTSSFTLQISDTVIAIANGMNNTAGYNPPSPFRLDTLMGAREFATDPNNTDIAIMNGVSDLSPMDFRTGTSIMADAVAFGSFERYTEVPFGSYIFRVTNNSGSKSAGTYKLPLSVLGPPGQSAVLVTSGFRNPAANNNGPMLQPMLIPSYGGSFIPLSKTDAEAYARMQLIHNSADKMLDVVDLYIDNEKFDDIPFRIASPFFDAPVHTSINIAVAPKNSTSIADAFFTKSIKLDSGKVNIAVLNGIFSSSGYTPNPPLTLDVFANGMEEATSATKTDMVFVHGATDLQMVDINEGPNNLVNNFSYGNFNPYVSVNSSNSYVLTVTDASNSAELAKYKLQPATSGMEGKAVTMLLSGFKDPAANSNGAAYGLYYATAAGGPLVPLAVSTAIGDPASQKGNIAVWPNPAHDVLHIAASQVRDAAIYDLTGRKMMTVDAPGNIDISGLANGVYILKGTSGNQAFATTFTRQ